MAGEGILSTEGSLAFSALVWFCTGVYQAQDQLIYSSLRIAGSEPWEYLRLRSCLCCSSGIGFLLSIANFLP